MTNLEELRSKRASLKEDTDRLFSATDKVIGESQRVANLAGDSEKIITDLETEFEKRTKLHGQDIAFLFFAMALQCTRQYLLTDFKERLGDQESSKNTLGENSFDPHNASRDRSHRLYNPSLEEIISHPVPFDLNIGGENFGNPLSGYGKLGHRAATLGHDSVLGWIFGTANIATSTVTDAKFNSYHVGSDNLRDYFKSNANTALVLENTFDKLTNQGMDGKIIVGTSLAKEAVHLLSDVNSKNSLPLPIVTTFNPKLGSTLAKYGLDMSNVLNVGKQAALAEAINIIIAMIHRLTFGLDSEVDTKLYEVRTRKIITYSNVIASTSNIILVAMGSAVGAATDNPEMIRKSLKKLDVGGFLVTVGHLLNDKKFITQVKTEFVLNNFDKLIQGDC